METGRVIRFYGAAFAGAYWGVKYGIMGESINTKAAASDNKAKSLKTMEDYAENSVDYEDALRMSQWDDAPSASEYLANSSFYDNDLIFDLYTGKYTPKFQGYLDAGLDIGAASRIIQWENAPSSSFYLANKEILNNSKFFNINTGKYLGSVPMDSYESINWNAVVSKKDETRLDHVNKHYVPQINQETHSVFNGNPRDMVDLAWEMRGDVIL